MTPVAAHEQIFVLKSVDKYCPSSGLACDETKSLFCPVSLDLAYVHIYID